MNKIKFGQEEVVTRSGLPSISLSSFTEEEMNEFLTTQILTNYEFHDREKENNIFDFET